MKKFKLGRSILATLLASSMVLANCVMPVAAETDTITYVSLGDSMSNGYGLEGYNGNTGVEDYGDGSYANLFAQWLVAEGYATDVEHYQLAMSAMRAEDLHWLLELDYTDNEAVAISDMADWDEEAWNSKFTTGDYWTYHEIAHNYRAATAANYILKKQGDADAIAALASDPDAEKDMLGEAGLVAEYYQNAVKDADIISLGMGNGNFGVFSFGRLLEAIGFNGSPSDAMIYDVENAIRECEPEMQDKIRDLKDTLHEKANAFRAESGLFAGEENNATWEALLNTIVYTGVSYVLNYAGSLEAILQLNPDADIILVALMNTFAEPGAEVDYANISSIGDLMGAIFEPLNMFIAGLPTYMQTVDNGVYRNANFYYAEAPEVECLVNEYGEDFDEPTSVIRDRFVDSIVGPSGNGMVWGLLDGVSLAGNTVTTITLEDVFAYEADKLAFTMADQQKAVSCAIYLAFEDAIIAAADGAAVDLESVMGLGNLSPDMFTDLMDVLEVTLPVNSSNYTDEVEADLFDMAAPTAAPILAAGINSAVGQPVINDEGALALLKAEDQNAAVTAFVESLVPSMVKAGMSADTSVQAVMTYIHPTTNIDDILGCSTHTECMATKATFDTQVASNVSTYTALLNGAVTDAKTQIATNTAGYIGTLCTLYALPETLSDALQSNAEISGLLALFARCVIGNGLGAHPSATGHIALCDALADAYGEGYTAKDETIKNIVDLVKEYYDEAYAYAYAQADANGYVDIAADAIDKAINVITTLNFEDVEMTDEFRAELAAELAAVVATLEEVKAVLAEDRASDVNGLYNAVIALQDDLYTHLANAGAILAQAGNDVNDLAVPVVEAYIKDVIVPVIDAYVKAAIEAYFGIADITEEAVAKTTHKKYVADEDSRYVALGGKTALGTGLVYPAVPYYVLVAGELEIDNFVGLGNNNLLPSGIYDYVTANAGEIANADFITYQTDASGFIYSLLSETPDWNKYIDAETQELISDIIEKTTEVLEANWSEYANAQVSEIVADIKAKVLESVSEYDIIDGIVEKAIDSVIELIVPYISDAIAQVADKKDAIYAPIASLDETVIDYAEKLAYAFVAYAVDTVKSVEAIQAINPEAVVYIVGMFNPLNGLQITTEDATIDAGKIFDYVIKATNLYYTGYAVANGNVAFVDVSETETFGSGTTLEIDATNIDLDSPGAILGLVNGIETNMLANAAGHEYIKDQIVAATKCDYSVYEAIDADNHALKCSLCGDVKETEAHSFDGLVCTKCGYEKVVVPTPEPTATPEPTPAPIYGGGGGGVSKLTVKFDTNGGSKIANVFVKKGEVLTKPADPTKDGYVFDGWYTDKELTTAYDFSQPVTKSFTLYAKWGLKFTDLDKNAWYYDYVKAIVEAGLMKGISETEFAPNMTLTRGMFVTILHRVEGEAKAEGELVFTDVAADAYYAEAIKWANANGIVKGVSETEFAPDADVTREQMAAMIARYAEFKKIEVTAEGEVVYTDSDSISDYAKEPVVTTNKLGLLIGNDDGSFAPQRNTTRAEAAALFVRLLGVIEK